MAAAIALFRAERDREPDKLEDLVPDYLPKIPLSPCHNDALRFHDGSVFAYIGPEYSLEWSLRN